jgi:flagellar hook-associated protein 2
MSSTSLSSSILQGLLENGASNPTSSGTDLSSILEVATGASSTGIDVTSAVNSAVTAARAPETEWKNEQSTISSQETDLKTAEGDVATLENDLSALGSSTGVFSGLTTNSTDSNIVTATAGTGASIGTNTVQVNSLASTSSWYSTTPMTSASTGLAAGTFSIAVGSGVVTTITVGGGETLTQLASAINAQNLGVTASVVTDDTGARLSLVSNSSGAAGNISITTSTSNPMQFAQAAAGVDASLSVNGVPISSASNTVTGAIPGVTLNLNSASPGSTVTIATSADTTAITSAITQFVNDYNTTINFVNSEYTYNGSSSAPPLEGDSALDALQGMLLGSCSYVASGGGSLSTLGGLGITMNNDGTLSLDNTTLDNAIQNNFSEVQNFFQGSSLNGFANSLQNQLETLTDPSDGAFTVDLNTLQGTYTDLGNQITDFEDNYIANLQTNLTAEYDSAEISLQTLSQTRAQINAELGNNNNSGS